MNSGFYKDLDTNFEQAYEMSQREFSYSELLEMLKCGNIPQKQIAAMKLKEIKKEDSFVLVNNLTGCDGKIREAVALKINQFLSTDRNYINYFAEYYKTFADATIDINGNICRLVIDSVGILKENKMFADKYTEELLKLIDSAFKGLDKIVFRDKKYTVNKQLFKLFWCLESLKLFAADIDRKILFFILERASKEREYTIREKAAQILILLDDSIFNPIKENLKNDENYYVKRTLIS